MVALCQRKPEPTYTESINTGGKGSLFITKTCINSQNALKQWLHCHTTVLTDRSLHARTMHGHEKWWHFVRENQSRRTRRVSIRVVRGTYLLPKHALIHKMH